MLQPRDGTTGEIGAGTTEKDDSAEIQLDEQGYPLLPEGTMKLLNQKLRDLDRKGL